MIIALLLTTFVAAAAVARDHTATGLYLAWPRAKSTEEKQPATTNGTIVVVSLV